MKKLVVAILFVAVSALAACSSYTCPTYAKAPQKQGKTASF